MLQGLPGPTGGKRHMHLSSSNVEAGVAVEEEEEVDYEDEDWEYMDESQVYLRSKFYESWMWMDVKLPSQTDKDG